MRKPGAEKRKKRKAISSRVAVVLTVLVFCMTVLPSLTAFAAEGGEDNELIDPSQYDGKKVGVQTGTIHVELAGDYIDNPELYYYKSQTDGIIAVQDGKIDAFMSDEPILQYYQSRVEGVRCGKIDSEKDEFATAAGITEKGKLYISQLNDYIVKIRESGELDRLCQKWIYGSDEERIMDISSNLPATNGEIVIATTAGYPPMTYMKEGETVGLEIEIIMGFCREFGYKPVIEITEVEGILAGTVSGKYDLAVSALTVTEERKESLLFAEPYCISQVGLVVKNDEADAGLFSLEKIKSGFTKTFITENRWKSFLSGIDVTLKITIMSILIGSILGFLVHLICRRGGAVSGKLSAFARWLIQGMPEVVLLMIMYYIVFGKSALSGENVAIIVFSLCFACVVHNLLEAGEKGLDPGQKTAAIALGYSDLKAFIRIILPQVARGFMPAYLTAVSTHIKATAVVGYIAVVDITKVGDIIRGTTYEPFFPLISVAVLYFVMAGILRVLIKLAARKLDPERRTREKILKGAVIK